MSKVTLEYFGVEATGRNVTEAKKDAGRKIERFVKNHSPHYVTFPGFVSVIIPQPQGGYCIEHPLFCGECRDTGGSSYTASDLENAIATEVGHIAQLATVAPVSPDTIIREDSPLWKQCPEVLRGMAYRSYISWVNWQVAYQFAPSDCEDRHQWACNHQQDFHDGAPIAMV